jgi:DNA polymerase III subunit beta
MKIICSQSELKNNLAFVSRAVPARPEPLVLGNILLIADETSQKITMTAFDGSLGIRASIIGEVIAGGVIALPAKLFNDIVSRLPEMEITLDCGEKRTERTTHGFEETSNPVSSGLVATLNAASSKLQLNGMDGSEFPELPIVKSDRVIELPVSILLEGLKGCLFAASAELAKQVLTGVHLSGSGDNSIEEVYLEFAATDSHRLAVVRAFLNDIEEEKDSERPNIDYSLTDLAVTIPSRALREVEKMVSEGQSTVKMRYDETQIVFESGAKVLNTLRLTGAYPPYQRLIPTTFSRYLTCDRKRLLSSLELVSVMAQKNNIVKFSLNGSESELTLSVDTPDVGNAKQSLPAEITGEDIEIAFNIKYLMDGIKAISAPEIKMQLNEWNQPVIFTPLSGLQVTYLVMPVQIRN